MNSNHTDTAATGSPCVMVIFGASGDLTKRKLIPALINLKQEGLLSEQFAIVGFAFDQMNTESFRAMLGTMTSRLEADTGHIEMSFPFFIMKRAPISGVESLMDYQAKLIGEHHEGKTKTWVQVEVPVTSLCPCSKKISDYGAHNQRSHVTITVRLRSHMWIEELIEIAESEASCELYGILKRPDEKYVTERAYDNPKFVEDMVRDVATRLNEDERVAAYVVESENFESIHNHSAYALIEHDKDA